MKIKPIKLDLPPFQYALAVTFMLPVTALLMVLASFFLLLASPLIPFFAFFQRKAEIFRESNRRCKFSVAPSPNDDKVLINE